MFDLIQVEFVLNASYKMPLFPLVNNECHSFNFSIIALKFYMLTVFFKELPEPFV